MFTIGTSYALSTLILNHTIGVFHQIDTLAIPGAGLWDLDFPAIDVQSMLEGLPLSPSNTGEITSGSGSVSAPSVKFQSPPQEPTRVRAYGSEDDM